MPKADPNTTTQAELRRTLPLGDELPAAIARMRQIAAEAADHLLLGDGPPHPDAKLLDHCEQALSLFKMAKSLDEARGEWECPDGDKEKRAQQDAMWAERLAATKRAAALLREIRKLRATTAAGIYAKALCVRASRSGASVLAMSLAEDLSSNASLRVTLWPAVVA